MTVEEYLEKVKARPNPCPPGGGPCEIDWMPTPDGEMKTCSPTCPVLILRDDVRRLLGMVNAFIDHEGWPMDNLPWGVEDLVPEDK